MHRQKNGSGNEEHIAFPPCRLTMCILDVVSRRKTVQMGNQWMEKGSGQKHILFLSADMQIRRRRELPLIRSAELLNGRVEELKRRRRERSTTTDNYY
ncbi:hypothetical protein M513_14151, partial [Trichuris suis]